MTRHQMWANDLNHDKCHLLNLGEVLLCNSTRGPAWDVKAQIQRVMLTGQRERTKSKRLVSAAMCLMTNC